MATRKRIRFVTDSTCDISQELIDRWQITVVPCFVNHGGMSYADDGVELVREDFYDQLPFMSPIPTTAAPPPAVVEPLVKAAFENADHLVIITVASRLSSVYNSLRLASAGLPPDRVTLVDSQQLSMGMGWQVLIGAEVAEATGDVRQVLDAVRRVRENQRVYCAVATLEFLRRSGRVNALFANLGTLFQIKPMIEVTEGQVLPVARIRTFHSALDKLVGMARAEAPLERLAIFHINNEAGAEEVNERLRDIAPPGTLVGRINPAIGVHLGPGSVGVGTVSKKWRR
jgi:DegV family protein with EDD domain